MDEENKKRISIEDLPKAEVELTDDEARTVQGGLTKIGGGTLILGNASSIGHSGNTIGGTAGSVSGNTIGGTLAGDHSNPAKP